MAATAASSATRTARSVGRRSDNARPEAVRVDERPASAIGTRDARNAGANETASVVNTTSAAPKVASVIENAGTSNGATIPYVAPQELRGSARNPVAHQATATPNTPPVIANRALSKNT